MTEAADNLFVELWQSSQEEREQQLLKYDSALRAEVQSMFDEHERYKDSEWLASPVSASRQLSETHTFDKSDTARHRSKRKRGYRDTDPPSRIGRYETRRVLGRGGFAVVCEAWDPNFERPVAIKLTHDPIANEEMREYFMDEARRLVRLDHDHIVEVLDVECTDDEHVYIVMEYISGGSLNSYLRAHRNLAMTQIADILARVADAVSYIHQKGNQIIHRDIKPANILLSGDPPSPKLADFGMAIRDNELDAQAGGTWDYMSPEQITHFEGSSSELPDVTSDVWALGVVLFEMLTGERPFNGKREVLEKPVPWPRQLCPDRNIPHELEKLCRKCLVRDRDKRTIGAGDVASELREFIEKSSNEEELQPDPTATSASPPNSSSNRLVRRVVALLAVALVLGSGLAIFWVSRGRSYRPVDRFAEPGKPISVLYRKPKLRSMHGTPPKMSQPTRGGSITVVSTDRMFVELDETEKNRFELELAFEKSNWSGQFGVYWGYRPIVFNDRDCFLANAVMLKCTKNTQGVPTLELTRHLFRFEPLTPNGYSIRDIAPTAAPFVIKRRVRSNAGIIRIVIDADSPVTLKWHDIKVPWSAGKFDEHRGPFGFINIQGDAVINRGNFLIPKGKKEP